MIQFLRHAPLKDECGLAFSALTFVRIWGEKGLHCPRDPHVAQACGCERLRVPFLRSSPSQFPQTSFAPVWRFPSFLKERHQVHRWFEAFGWTGGTVPRSGESTEREAQDCSKRRRQEQTGNVALFFELLKPVPPDGETRLTAIPQRLAFPRIEISLPSLLSRW